ncbi:MAG: carboxypeptidase regulatory-like domain-containing protein, partial [Deltaproteobacteria bacterium]|nr:carboxypeptidase regulatory-like domain-containing protein [Deltaproteobacteria bacterium]
FVPQGLNAPPGATVKIEGAPVGTSKAGRVTVSNILIAGGESVTISLRVKIDAKAEAGETICNVANFSAQAGIDLASSAPACVLLGSPRGTGSLAGTVFRDIGKDNGVFEEGDEKLAALQIQAYLLGDPNATPAAGAISDTDGHYRLPGLLPGSYVLRVLTAKGTQLGTKSAVEVGSGEATRQDIAVDPTGIIYDASKGGAVANIRATLYYDKTDPLAPGEKVPGALLGQGQQDQVSDESGFYRFDGSVGRRFRIALTPLSLSKVAPSSLIPVHEGLAKVGAEAEVVSDDTPEPKREGAKLIYYLRFEQRGVGYELHNNHLPVDPITSLIKLKKRGDRVRASLGDLVTYTITVENRSRWDFLAEGKRVGIEDLLPRGLRLIRGSLRRIRRLAPKGHCLSSEKERKDVDGARVCVERGSLITSKTGRILHMGPFPLGAGEIVRMVYQVAVGLESKPGVYENLAVLK